MKLAAVAIAVSLLGPSTGAKRQNMDKCEGAQLTLWWTDGTVTMNQWKECKPSQYRRRR